MIESPVAYVGIMIGAGTRDEEVSLNGLAHYVEHCVFKGCVIHPSNPIHGGTKLSAREIIHRIEGIGGEINAYTTKEETAFYAAVPVGHYATTARLLAGMVLHPTFPKKETDVEIGVIYDEIESYNDSPSELIYDDFEGLLFEGNELALPVLGTKKSLRKIGSKPQYATDWVKNHFRPERMVFFSQGKIPFHRVCRIAEQIFADSETGTATTMPSVRKLPHTIGSKTAEYRRHTHQAHIMIGGGAYPLGHEKQLGLYLTNNILGGGSLNSRLNMSLREKRGLVYTIESQYTPLSDTGYWNIYLATETQNMDQCIELVQQELKRLKDERMSSLQVERALKQLHGQMAISAENRENEFLSMGKQMLYHGIAPTWEEVFPKIACTNARQIQDIANEVYSEVNRNTLLYI